MQDPSSTVESTTSNPSTESNIMASNQTPHSVNVNLDTVPNVAAAKSVGPLLSVAIGVLIVGSFAAAIAVPVVLSQQMATASVTSSVAWNTTTTTATTTTSLTTSTATTTTTTSTSTTSSTSTSSSTSTTSTTSSTSSTSTSSSTSSTSTTSRTTSTSSTTTSSTSTSTTSTSTTSTSTTTTARPIVLITRAGDPIIGVYNTTAGGNIGGVNGSYSGPSESPPYGIDDDTTTKYLNFSVNSGGITAYQPGLNTGYYVTPLASNSSIAFGLLFATGNDSPERDPITVTLEGANVTTSAALSLGSSWTLIYSGSTGINVTADPGRSIFVPQQNFTNSLGFRSYRLLVTSQRSNGSCIQFAEGLIIGYL